MLLIAVSFHPFGQGRTSFGSALFAFGPLGLGLLGPPKNVLALFADGQKQHGLAGGAVDFIEGGFGAGEAHLAVRHTAMAGTPLS